MSAGDFRFAQLVVATNPEVILWSQGFLSIRLEELKSPQYAFANYDPNLGSWRVEYEQFRPSFQLIKLDAYQLSTNRVFIYH